MRHLKTRRKLNLIKKHKLPSLIILALLCGVIWRAEVEYYGWQGLIWISYFHIAIPIGFGLFLIWANTFFDLSLFKRVLLNLTAVLFGILVYFGLGISLTYMFNGGPSAFIMEMHTSEWQSTFIAFSHFILIPLIPIGIYFILRLFKIRRPWKSLLNGIIGIIISIPVSIILLELLNHKGEQDFIHSIKSGILIPLWIISIGLIIIGEKTNAQQNV